MAATCLYCHAKKGKRPCPAIKGLICSLCCGEHRVTTIACPADCSYLKSGTDYQQHRADERLRLVVPGLSTPNPAHHHHGPGCKHT